MRCFNSNQRGGATLVVTLILFGVMTLVAAYANRNHLFEQRASANQYRSTRAFEAAEAGLEWATAMLNNPRPLNDRCIEGEDASARFRERYLTSDPPTGALRPVIVSDAGRVSALRAVCVKTSDSWRCACPRDTKLDLLADLTARPAFAIEFSQDAQAGAVHLTAVGCTSLAGECFPARGKSDVIAHIQTTLGAWPAIATLPVAPLTTKDSVNAGNSSLGLHNADAASGGASVHAGRSMIAPNARLTTAPGSSPEGSIIENDTSLSALTADRFFVSFFGIDKALWKQQPAVKSLRCNDSCGDAMSTALASGHRLIWIDGDAELSGPLTIGSREQPILIVATGMLRLTGPVRIAGVVYAANLSWQGAGGGQLRGAAISESTYDGDASPDFIYEPAVLAALKSGAGSFARLPGTWKDF